MIALQELTWSPVTSRPGTTGRTPDVRTVWCRRVVFVSGMCGLRLRVSAVFPMVCPEWVRRSRRPSWFRKHTLSEGQGCVSWGRRLDDVFVRPRHRVLVDRDGTSCVPTGIRRVSRRPSPPWFVCPRIICFGGGRTGAETRGKFYFPCRSQGQESDPPFKSS